MHHLTGSAGVIPRRIKIKYFFTYFACFMAPQAIFLILFKISQAAGIIKLGLYPNLPLHLRLAFIAFALLAVILAAWLTTRSIIKLRRTEIELRQSENRLKMFVEHAPAAIAMFDNRMRYIAASRRWLTDYGLNDANLAGRSHYEVFPEISDEWKEIHRQGLAGASFRRDADPFPRLDGTVDYVKWENLPWRDNSGEIGGIIMFTEVITERVRAKKELENYRDHLEELVAERTQDLAKANERLREDIQAREQAEESLRRQAQIMDQIHDAVIGVDLTGLITLWNKGAEKLFGYTPDEAIGQHISRMYPEGIAEASLEQINRHLTDSGAFEEESVRRRKSGEMFPVQLSISRLIDENGHHYGSIGYFMDITARKTAEAELARAKAEAEAASEAKSRFLANMSHEIRTPMNAIIGMTDLALNTSLTPEQREFLDTVRVSADALLDLINDILDLSKIEAGYLKLETDNFDLRGLIDSTLKALAIKAHEKQLEIAAFFRPGTNRFVRGDHRRLRQVLVNLIGNAIKFTDRGEILVTAENLADDAGPGSPAIHFTVADTGIGITRDMLDKIFLPFTQADSSRTKRFAGTGLGTTISKQLVEMMGGRIWVESEIGRGSAFHFTIPFEPGQPLAVAPDSSPHGIAGLKVLVVDDNRTNRRILREMIKNWDATPIEAESGPAALTKLTDIHASGGRVDLAVLDLHMPGMDGIDLAGTILAQDRWATLPIIFLSSVTMPEEAAILGAFARTTVLPKPIGQDALLGAMLTLLGHRGAARAVRPPVDEAARQSFRVLLAEDNPLNQKVAAAIMDKRGHRTTIVKNGREAVETWSREPFDVILMDVQMPEMDGLEAARIIRIREAERGLARIPIAAMTAYAMTEERDQCLAAGMDAHLSKPFRQAEFIRTVESLAAGLTPASVARTPEAPDASTFDLTFLLEVVDGDLNQLTSWVGMLFRDIERRMAEIREAVPARNLPQVRQSAHSLKGMVGQCAARAVVDKAGNIETLAHNGIESGLEDACRDLEKEIRRFRDDLTAFLGANGPTGISDMH